MATMAIALMCVVCGLSSCSEDEGLVKMSSEKIIEEDTIEITDTVIVEKGWSVNVNVNNFGDSIAIDVELENGEDKHNLSGYAVFFPVKKKYQILADQEYLSLEFANNGRTGGKNERENATSSRWIDSKVFYYPCEDGNILVCKTKMEHIANLPYVRVSDAVLNALTLKS
ncbi:MAG: hypothetical protein MJ212_03440, partial [Alphaproteobacteria bacterium]|nr:hypothetical protein [Alphaproteobacteria bacterium]